MLDCDSKQNSELDNGIYIVEISTESDVIQKQIVVEK